jgi:hypothetical protein
MILDILNYDPLVSVFLKHFLKEVFDLLIFNKIKIDIVIKDLVSDLELVFGRLIWVLATNHII